MITPKSRLIALLLAWFTGPLGGHRFYVGKNGSAIAMLLCTLSVIGLLASIPWMFVDLITIAVGAFRDAEGRVVYKWEASPERV
jgi:TM2 domain-containing membrane protein YozV